MRKTLWLSLALVIALSAMLLAGSEDRIGTAGAQELRISVGSRGVAMGGALVANCSGTEALYWNPAGVVRQSGTEAMFSHLDYFAGMKRRVCRGNDFDRGLWLDWRFCQGAVDRHHAEDDLG